MNVTLKSVGMISGALVSIFVLIGMSYQAIKWVDNHYIDTTEAQELIDSQTSILQLMNDNIVNIGTAIYDSKLAEIDKWISDLAARTDRNDAETAFLSSLKERRKEILAQKEKLGKVRIGHQP